MRRSASEIIRNLEMRIARLERRAGLVLDSKEQKHLNELTDSIRRFFQDSNTAASLFSKGGEKYKSFAKKLQEMNDLIAEVSKELPDQVRSLNKEEVKDSKKASSVPSPLAKKLNRILPDGMRASVFRGKFGHNEVHISWNPNNVYSEFDMTEDDYDYLGDNDLSTHELRIALEEASRFIRKNVRDSEIVQDKKRSDMDMGLIVYNLL